MADARTNGGYDDGYRECPCFWGRSPSSAVLKALNVVGDPTGLAVLDLGCGEGKNAAYLAALGARVDAIDVSPLAINNARRAFPDAQRVTWSVGDALDYLSAACSNDTRYDIVIAYGLLHCLPEEASVQAALTRMRHVTGDLGLHVVCAFNDRHQELSAHPNFNPFLWSHRSFVDDYSRAGWNTLLASDEDLTETHPHNGIEHTHSMTRLIARRP